MRGAALALALLCVSAHAQEPEPPTDSPRMLEVDHAKVGAKDGAELRVVGGCWLSERECIATGREVAALRAENASLRKSWAGPPSIVAVVAAVVVALPVGFFVGRAIR